VTSGSGSVRVAAIVPVGSLEGAKSRLGGSLDAEERRDLVERLLDKTVRAALDAQTAGSLSDVLVVSPDRDVLEEASRAGARTLRQRSTGLNAGLDEGRQDVVAGGAEAILIVPIDLPFVSETAIGAVVTALGRTDPGVVLVTDRAGVGTNVLGLRPPGIIGFAFGAGSRVAHRAAAAAAGADYGEVDGPLRIDLDTPEDLVLVETTAPESLGVG